MCGGYQNKETLSLVPVDCRQTRLHTSRGVKKHNETIMHELFTQIRRSINDMKMSNQD